VSFRGFAPYAPEDETIDVNRHMLIDLPVMFVLGVFAGPWLDQLA